MADNIRTVPSVNVADPPVATNDIGGIHYPRVKAGFGAAGSWIETADVDGVRLPVGGAQIGLLTETAPTTDIASSGLNGRLQRVAQRLTSLIGQLPATLGQKASAASLAVVLASDQSAVPMTLLRRETVIAMTVAISGNLSTTADTAGYGNMGLVVPTTFDGTQIEFWVSHDNATFVRLMDITNTQVVMTVTPSRAYDVPGELLAWRYVAINCVTAQATTTTVFQLVLRS